MDKYEYKVRSAQIKSLIENGEYREAVKIADTIDWSRVPSVSRLLTISELYMINKRYEESKEILLLAKDRHPNGRSIIYRLCEICIKLNEIGEAVAYLGQYDQKASDPSGSLVLRYKILVSQGSGLEERIKVLEDLKNEDYQEKWAYELATLYSEAGDIDKCVSECNELITWFGPDGKYGEKALDLKERYDIVRQSALASNEKNTAVPQPEKTADTGSIPIQVTQVNASDQPTQKIPDREVNNSIYGEDFSVKPVNLDKNATINLQAELKRSMEELAGSFGEGVQELPVQGMDPNDPYNYYQSRGYDVQQAPAGVQSAPVPDEDMRELHSEDYAQEMQAEQQQGQVYSAPQYEGALYGYAPQEGQFVGMRNMVSEEYDGQMRLNVPEPPSEIEKQITGQMDFQEILDGWEKRTEENNRRRVEGAKRKSLEQTNDIVNQLKDVIPGIIIHENPDEIGRKPEPPQPEPKAVRRAEEPVRKARPEEDRVSEFDIDAEGMRPKSEKTGKIIADDTLNMLSYDSYPADEGYEEYQDEYNPEDYDGDYDTDYGREGGYDEDGYPQSDEYIEDDYYPEDEEYPEDGEYSEEGYDGEYPSEDYEDGYANGDAYDGQEGYGEDEASGDAGYDTPDAAYGTPGGELTEDEREIFKDFLLMHDLPTIIRDALSRIGMEGSRGNVIITGNEQSARINFCGALAKDLQLTHPDFIGKIAKISADVFNKKDISRSIAMLDGGALVIENAAELTNQTLQEMVRVLNQPEIRILMMLEDNHFYQKRVGENIPGFSNIFDVHINIPAYTNDDLVFHGREYARQKEYTIDNMGVLALYRRVDQLQTANHFVTLNEVEDIVDEAIENVDKRSVGHFMDVLLAKRYDDEDMIILREKDFDARKQKDKN